MQNSKLKFHPALELHEITSEGKCKLAVIRKCHLNFYVPSAATACTLQYGFMSLSRPLVIPCYATHSLSHLVSSLVVLSAPKSAILASHDFIIII